MTASGEVAAVLTSIAAEAIDNPSSAGARLADWIGREPSPAGEARMQQIAHLAPRLVADALLRDGWAQPDVYGPARTDVPAAQLAAVRAVARHLSGEADTADAVVDAYITAHGLQGLWDFGVAALRLLSDELRDQQRDNQR
ncbi:hypothetical protein [Amycolatopsis keratiniphila]|uniref:Uncharacterized protein n=1 Tax=Amycolatopsis keratiniphila subsp. keratiniphila TaxID=227715 RepID=A0A1W2M286_9PSEU|nr:hypothetical protein [Amycolatopsis keratiniphila]ONF73971.1 hypothetical protein AVR91_0204370 [Amycolatopsis keratiniphila subsp. keratiniphila]